MTNLPPKIQKIHIPGLALNARVWGPENGLPVLGMHGWLDNAATFDLIAPLLPKIRLVSVDFPGHGFSDFLPPSANYGIVDRALQMLRVADALGFTQFSILGHSLGGIVGEIMAAMTPERIEKIALIDVFGGISLPAESIVQQLQKHYRAKERTLPHTVYASLEDAAEMRAKVNATRQLSVSGARVLAEGGMQKVPGGYSWTFDLRLQLPSPLILTDEQLQTVLNNFKSDCLLIYAKDGILHEYKGFVFEKGRFPNVRVVEFEGGHHLHLDTPEPVAKVLSEFFEGDES